MWGMWGLNEGDYIVQCKLCFMVGGRKFCYTMAMSKGCMRVAYGWDAKQQPEKKKEANCLKNVKQ